MSVTTERPASEDSMFVPTGKSVFYLHSCPVLTWLYLHGQLVVPESNEFIRSGRALDQDRWAHKRSLDLMPYGKCDWVTGTQALTQNSASPHDSLMSRMRTL